jgi:prepilin-type N-terminal cleavage/methylation domain-containing protein
MKINLRYGKSAFTLIELMAVITIIVILAGIVVSGLGYMQDKQARSQAQVQIQLLSKAIEDYKLDMGSYPGLDTDTIVSGDVSEQLYKALFKDGYDYTSQTPAPANWTNATRIYLTDLDPRSSKQGWVIKTTVATPPDNLKITDPWGNNYHYRKGANAVNPDFDLWSTGKDGVTDLGAVKDDIRNF